MIVLSRVYSPYLGRYVRKFASQTGSVRGARTRSFASPLAATGDLVSYGFPSSAEAGKEAPWNCDVKNTGTDGVVGFGIVNNAGNPGSIVVKWDGKDTTIEPGYYWRVYTAASVPNGTHLTTGGTVTFPAEGSHTVRLWAMHQEGESWLYDKEVVLPVSIAPSDGGGGGQEWPFEYALHLVDAVVLQTNWWETGKAYTAPKFRVGDTEHFLGARLDYSITWQEGNVGTLNVGIDVNSNTQVTGRLNPGGLYGPKVTTIEGSTEVTQTLYRVGNVLRVGQNQAPGYWSKVIYNVTITLGYSQKPTTDPGQEEKTWEELLEEYKWWIAGGGILAAWAILSSKGYAPSTTIMVTQPYEYVKERLEERKR